MTSSRKDTNTTNFRGRLGYACLNVFLRKQKPSIFCARTCRIETIKEKGMGYVRELGLQNIRDLLELVKFNEKHNIKFMRVSSQMFPFASSIEYGYSLEFAEKELRQVGEFAAKHGHRLTTHPGQFNQLGSPTRVIVEKTIRDLDYHAEMLDLMGLPPDSIMIIHMGGTYGNKEETMERFEMNYLALSPRIKNRLVLENDELSYCVQDLLPLCQKLSIPLVLDWHHHKLHPGTLSLEDLLAIIPEVNKTWTDRGLKPKQHYSESRRGANSKLEKRAHFDRVVQLPPCDPDMDLMIEAKDKEQAVFQLYQKYNLFEVDNSVLVPPDEVESTRTKGRKSNKRKVIEVEAEVSDDEESQDALVEEIVKNTRKRGNNGSRKRKKDEEIVVNLNIDNKSSKNQHKKDVSNREEKINQSDTTFITDLAYPSNEDTTILQKESSNDTIANRTRRKTKLLNTGL
ncbi:5418_t:CDS:1 [Ambispora leptoticha]|uniref:5418_t:CDS:1 n=1 Tax=Ambispora leptoticha TaxID=144679 RepID=A0A9N8WL88_9GLOM|nr:5418_t:CDS:1 [Ambispora leptoticha]